MVGFFQYKWQTRLSVGRKAEIAQGEVEGMEQRKQGKLEAKKRGYFGPNIKLGSCAGSKTTH